jgi:hypothetical protein
MCISLKFNCNYMARSSLTYIPGFLCERFLSADLYRLIPYYMLKSSSLCSCSSNLGTFWLKVKQFWPFEETSIFSNGGHLGWRAWLSDIFLKGTHTGTITARFGLIWFSGFRGEDAQFA